MPMRTFLNAKIHGLAVTQTRLDYEGSVTLDPLLMEAAGILPNEQVDIYNMANGARLTTYAIPGERGKGECGINGAAARLASVGDEVIIVNYIALSPEEWAAHKPKVIRPKKGNRV